MLVDRGIERGIDRGIDRIERGIDRKRFIRSSSANTTTTRVPSSSGSSGSRSPDLDTSSSSSGQENIPNPQENLKPIARPKSYGNFQSNVNGWGNSGNFGPNGSLGGACSLGIEYSGACSGSSGGSRPLASSASSLFSATSYTGSDSAASEMVFTSVVQNAGRDRDTSTEKPHRRRTSRNLNYGALSKGGVRGKPDVGIVGGNNMNVPNANGNTRRVSCKNLKIANTNNMRRNSSKGSLCSTSTQSRRDNLTIMQKKVDKLSRQVQRLSRSITRSAHKEDMREVSRNMEKNIVTPSNLDGCEQGVDPGVDPGCFLKVAHTRAVNTANTTAANAAAKPLDNDSEYTDERDSTRDDTDRDNNTPQTVKSDVAHCYSIFTPPSRDRKGLRKRKKRTSGNISSEAFACGMPASESNTANTSPTTASSEGGNRGAANSENQADVVDVTENPTSAPGCCEKHQQQYGPTVTNDQQSNQTSNPNPTQQQPKDKTSWRESITESLVDYLLPGLTKGSVAGISSTAIKVPQCRSKRNGRTISASITKETSRTEEALLPNLLSSTEEEDAKKRIPPEPSIEEGWTLVDSERIMIENSGKSGNTNGNSDKEDRNNNTDKTNTAATTIPTKPGPSRRVPRIIGMSRTDSQVFRVHRTGDAVSAVGKRLARLRLDDDSDSDNGSDYDNDDIWGDNNADDNDEKCDYCDTNRDTPNNEQCINAHRDKDTVNNSERDADPRDTPRTPVHSNTPTRVSENPRDTPSKTSPRTPPHQANVPRDTERDTPQKPPRPLEQETPPRGPPEGVNGSDSNTTAQQNLGDFSEEQSIEERKTADEVESNETKSVEEPNAEAENPKLLALIDQTEKPKLIGKRGRSASMDPAEISLFPTVEDLHPEDPLWEWPDHMAQYFAQVFSCDFHFQARKYAESLGTPREASLESLAHAVNQDNSLQDDASSTGDASTGVGSPIGSCSPNSTPSASPSPSPIPSPRGPGNSVVIGEEGGLGFRSTDENRGPEDDNVNDSSESAVENNGRLRLSRGANEAWKRHEETIRRSHTLENGGDLSSNGYNNSLSPLYDNNSLVPDLHEALLPKPRLSLPPSLSSGSSISSYSSGASDRSSIDSSGSATARMRRRPSFVPRQLRDHYPSHKFLKGERQTRWAKVRKKRPLNMYVDDKTLIREVRRSKISLNMSVDDKTLIREVADIKTLKRGDHCLVTINMFRTVHPVIDYFVSWLTFAEVYTMYHHFIVLHDVDHVDASGAPRQENGEACCIAEFAGTLQDSMEMVRQSMPLPTLLYHKAFFQVVPLADYGDQFVYRVENNFSEQQRDEIIERCEDFIEKQKKSPLINYNFILRNCEHYTNLIVSNEWRSPQIPFMFWHLCRSIVVLGSYCCWWMEILQGYQFFSLICLSVVITTCIRRVWSLMKQKRKMRRREYWHLIRKESFRGLTTASLVIYILFYLVPIVKPSAATVLIIFVHNIVNVTYDLLCRVILQLLLRVHQDAIVAPDVPGDRPSWTSDCEGRTSRNSRSSEVQALQGGPGPVDANNNVDDSTINTSTAEGAENDSADNEDNINNDDIDTIDSPRAAARVSVASVASEIDVADEGGGHGEGNGGVSVESDNGKMKKE